MKNSDKHYVRGLILMIIGALIGMLGFILSSSDQMEGIILLIIGMLSSLSGSCFTIYASMKSSRSRRFS